MDTSTEQKTIATLIGNAELNRRHLLSIPKKLLHEPVQKYLRSGINPLIDAAALLFMFTNRLNTFVSAPPLEQLTLYLEHELKRYQTALRQLGFNDKITNHCAAILAITLEQTIAKAPWSTELSVPEQHLSSLIKMVTITSVREFIEETIDNETLDSVEFIYVSFSLGFSHPELDTTDTKEKLFRVINRHSGQKKLSHLSPTLRNAPPTTTPTWMTLISPPLFIMIAFVLLLTFFAIFNFMMSLSTKQATEAALAITHSSNPTEQKKTT